MTQIHFDQDKIDAAKSFKEIYAHFKMKNGKRQSVRLHSLLTIEGQLKRLLPVVNQLLGEVEEVDLKETRH